jgi:hypothetical protein
MKFGEAITLLNAGHPVSRQGWNGKGMFLIRAGGYKVEADAVKPNGPINAEFLKRRGLTHLEILPHIDMWTVNSEGRQAYLPGWLASQSDMLADDWMEYKEPVEEKKPRTLILNDLQVKALKKVGAWRTAPPIVEQHKKPHWTQTPEGKKIMAKRRTRGSKK